MNVAVRLTVSKIDRGHRREGSGHHEIDHNLLQCNIGLCSVELDCIFNGLPLRRFALSECF